MYVYEHMMVRSTIVANGFNLKIHDLITGVVLKWVQNILKEAFMEQGMWDLRITLRHENATTNTM